MNPMSSLLTPLFLYYYTIGSNQALLIQQYPAYLATNSMYFFFGLQFSILALYLRHLFFFLGINDPLWLLGTINSNGILG